MRDISTLVLGTIALLAAMGLSASAGHGSRAADAWQAEQHVLAAQTQPSIGQAHAVKDKTVETRIVALCSELFRNTASGILLVISQNTRPKDRVCIQLTEPEDLKCKTVEEMRKDWQVKP